MKPGACLLCAATTQDGRYTQCPLEARLPFADMYVMLKLKTLLIDKFPLNTSVFVVLDVHNGNILTIVGRDEFSMAGY